MTDNPIDASVVNIVWQDAVIVDTDSEKKLAIFEVQEGLMSKEEYRMKFYGETLDTAREKLGIIEKDNELDYTLDMEGEE